MADEKRTLLVMLEPSDIKATAFLVQERKDTTDHMWLYLPLIDCIRQIIPVETYQLIYAICQRRGVGRNEGRGRLCHSGSPKVL